MAATEFATASSQNVLNWSTKTFREALKSTHLFKQLVGFGKKVNGMPTGKRAVIEFFDEMDKGSGDTVKYDLLMQMTQDPITGDNRAKGMGEALVYYQDSLVIDQMRFPHEFKRMSQQRTLHDLRKDAQENISDKCADTLESYMFRNFCGDATLTFGQVVVAPETYHYYVCGDVTHTGTIATDEASLGSNDQISLEELDYAKEKATVPSVAGVPPMRPVRIEGGEYFVVVVHPYQATDLRLGLGAGTNIDWTTIQQYANVRGLKNPVFTGALGVYHGMIIFESHHIYSPTTSVRRAVMLGAQAGSFALANPYDKVDQKKYGPNNYMSWAEDRDDYGNEKGICGGMVCGIKKNIFNSIDFATMVITSYAAAH